MPYETIQYPRTDAEQSAEISIHWSKGSHVQLQSQRHVWLGCPAPALPGEIDPGERELSKAPPWPIGTVRVGDGQIAYKTASGSADFWLVIRQSGSVEHNVTTEQIADWPVVHDGDGRSLSAIIWSEVLTRDQINHLIRALRTARDQAYGADA